MAVGYNPRAITDGLVLALDAGNPKNYNVGISTNWTDKVGGNNGTLVGGTHHNDGPFVGAGYVEFDGNTDKLSCTPSNLTGEFTIEGWWYANAFPATTVLFGNWGGGCLLRLADAGSELQWYTTGLLSGMRGSIGFTLSTGTWYHVAVSRDSSNVHRTFVNGTQIASETNSVSISMSNLCIGSENTSSGTTDIWNGYISNFRIVDGTALYTSDFTVPTKPLTAITNTTLLTCQGNTIADASSSALSITANGNAAANLGFPASAFEFDGSDDYILLDNGLGIGTDDFAISVWVKFDSVSGASGSANYRTVLSSYSGGLGYIFGLWISGNPVFEHYMDGTSYKGNTTIVADTWYNMVSTRLSGDLYLYLNGSLDNTPVSASTKDMADTATPRIGWIPSASQNGRLDGTVSDLKIYKGKGLTAAEVTQNYNATKGRYA